MADVAWEKLVSNVVYLLAMSLGAAWLLGMFGVDRPYFERVAASFLGLYFAIYTVAEGAEVGFSRCLTCRHEEHQSEEMPEAEQAFSE